MVASSTPFYARRSQPPSAELGNLKNRDVHRLKKIKSWFVAVPLVLCGIDVALNGFCRESAAIGHGHLDAGMQVMAKLFVMAALANKARELMES